MCHELGIATGIDLEKLIEVTYEAERILGRELASKVSKGEKLSFLSEDTFALIYQ